jgi:hypothetical protein
VSSTSSNAVARDVAEFLLCVVDVGEEEGLAFLPQRNVTVVWVVSLVGCAGSGLRRPATVVHQVNFLSFSLFSIFYFYFLF